MYLAVQVLLPGNTTLNQVQSLLNKLDKLGLNAQYLTGSVAPIQRGKTKAADDDGDDSFLAAEEISPQERLILEQGIARTLEEGSHDLLSSLTKEGSRVLKPNMSREIVAYFKENPGQTTAHAAGNLANKFEAHYDDINDAFMKIRNLINTMAHSKGAQKVLEKRGGRPGRGNDGLVYALG